MPRAEWRRLDGADRMGPGSHLEPIDRELERFLAQQQASWHCDPEPTAAFGRPVFRCRDHLWERPEAVRCKDPPVVGRPPTTSCKTY